MNNRADLQYNRPCLTADSFQAQLHLPWGCQNKNTQKQQPKVETLETAQKSDKKVGIIASYQ